MYLFSVVILLSISAFFVAAEFATVAAKTVKIEALAENGDASALRLLPYIQDANRLDRYVATCQIGITIASLALGAIGDKYVTPILWEVLKANFGETPWGLSEQFCYASLSVSTVLAFTSLQLVFGELLPKAVAVRNVEKVALWLSWPMEMSLKSLSVLIDIFNGSSDAILRTLGVPLGSGRHVHSRQELSTLVEHVDDEGEELKATEQARLKRALRFDEIIASDIMIPRNRMVCFDVNATRSEVIKAVLASPFTRFPVYEGSEDNIIGILHIKQLLLTGLRHEARADVQSIRAFVRPWFVFCPGTITLDKVLARLREKRASMAIIGDEYGGTAGLLTIEDMMEEVLGDIRDEFDSSHNEVDFRRLDNQDCLIGGAVPLEELRDNYEIDLLSEEAVSAGVHTIGGLMLHLSEGKEIARDFSLVHQGYKLKVQRIKGHAVLQVRVSKAVKE